MLGGKEGVGLEEEWREGGKGRSEWERKRIDVKKGWEEREKVAEKGEVREYRVEE